MADVVRVEEITHPAARRRGMVRVWRGDVLLGATCGVCGRLTDASDLVANAGKIGGHALICHRHNAERVAEIRAAEEA